jgi:hypothetical protein
MSAAWWSTTARLSIATPTRSFMSSIRPWPRDRDAPGVCAAALPAVLNNP